MKYRFNPIAIITTVFALCVNCAFAQINDDPLPSWNDGPAKRIIVDFVHTTTDADSAKFVPPEERIATFDQDGTLWVEKPVVPQIMYCLDQVAVLVQKKPEFKNIEPFKTVLSGDRASVTNLTIKDLEKVLVAALTGMTTEQFQVQVKEWLATARDSRWKSPYTELTYQPMQEVMRYLRANGYKTYIVTGGGQDFVRVYSKQTYGIPPENVVGTMGGIRYGYDKDGKPILTKEPNLLLNDDKAGKPEGIHLMIGRRPFAAFGNSDGDRQMLEYTKAGDGARLAMLVLHDDAIREYAYGPSQGLPDTKYGAFTQALYDQAQNEGWTVISMKKDWKRLFAFDQHAVTAIDIALEPDLTMIQHAIAANDRLLKVFPKGFTLDAAHHPHITMLQRYVRTEDLDKVFAAAKKVIAVANVADMKLQAIKYYYLPDNEIGVAGIVIERTDDLLKLQQELVDAIALYTVETGTPAAFVTTSEDPNINQAGMDYVATFVPKASGMHFNPHVTVGIATTAYLDTLLAEPFDTFMFSPTGASVYQIGNYGTAAKKLKELIN